MDASLLQLLWFVLIGVLFSGFFFLEGYDFGVGMQFTGLAQSDKEREVLYRAIGPNWDANEVWLLTAGGAMFASYPFWYASLFSGFYLMLFVVLLALIFRGASMEFQDRAISLKYRKTWHTLIGVSSFIAPFAFGMIFTAMVKGMPIDANGDITAHFTDYVNWFTLVGGVALTLMAYIHGLNFTHLKIEGAISKRADAQLKVLYPLLLAGEALFAVLVYFYTDFFQDKPVLTLILLGLIVVTTLLSWASSLSGHRGWGFILSGLILVELVALLFVGLFPHVMIANDPANSISIADASSTPYTLKVMTIVTITALPIALVYQIWSFIVFRRRMKIAD